MQSPFNLFDSFEELPWKTNDDPRDPVVLTSVGDICGLVDEPSWDQARHRLLAEGIGVRLLPLVAVPGWDDDQTGLLLCCWDGQPDAALPLHLGTVVGGGG